ncbi:MAG: phenylalanine--tRNA ligase subunit alpha [Clostridia bacterium]
MADKLDELREQALARIKEVENEDELNSLNTTFLGRNGALTGVLRTMGQLDEARRAVLGAAANKVKQEITEQFNKKREAMAKAAQERAFMREAVDITEPGKKLMPRGRLHPMTKTYREIRDALIGMGFTTFSGPEIEYDDYCFTLLNLPKGHPARDMQDTFYINENVVLRTHTSNCEARALMTMKPPFRIVIPGRCFRVDEVDATHSPIFMQMEGLVVDKHMTLRDLKGTLDAFVHVVFGYNVKTRLRPSYFPFTEPSGELDISCTICGGKGCRVCKGTGWIEILGCGVTNPNELINCGLDPKEWSAFAFGIGVDRVTSLKYGISDIRLEYENDARFLRQF